MENKLKSGGNLFFVLRVVVCVVTTGMCSNHWYLKGFTNIYII